MTICGIERKALIKILQYLKGLRGANLILIDTYDCLVLIGSHNAPYTEKEMLFINRKVLEILNEDKPTEPLYNSPVDNPISVQTTTGIKVFEILSGYFWKSGYKDKIGWFPYYQNQNTYLIPTFSAMDIKELKLKLNLYTRTNQPFLFGKMV
jgi:hypothetical protein